MSNNEHTYDELKPHLNPAQQQEIEDLEASRQRWVYAKWGAVGFIVLTVVIIGLM